MDRFDLWETVVMNDLYEEWEDIQDIWEQPDDGTIDAPPQEKWQRSDCRNCYAPFSVVHLPEPRDVYLCLNCGFPFYHKNKNKDLNRAKHKRPKRV